MQNATKRSIELLEESSKLEAEIELEVNPAIDRLIEAGILIPKAADAPLETRRRLAYRDSLFASMEKKADELNLSWNIEMGLY